MQPDRTAPLTVALYQPDIPQNTGTILRTCACLGLAAAIIEPAGFLASDKHFRRAGMDYLAHVEIARYPHWAAFEDWRRAAGRRLVLLTTRARLAYTAFSYVPGDILLVGRESAGVPAEVHAAADARLIIPLKPPMRQNCYPVSIIEGGCDVKSLGLYQSSSANRFQPSRPCHHPVEFPRSSPCSAEISRAGGVGERDQRIWHRDRHGRSRS
jgi:tRNA (cytidine/uridine-2'-O-)-methyltransferase